MAQSFPDCGLISKGNLCGNSLVVQRLGLRALTVEGPGSIPGRGIKIPQAVWHGLKKKKKGNL